MLAMGGDNAPERRQSKSLYDDIVEKLESNGGLTEKERRQFTLLALVDIGRRIEKLDGISKRVENLENNSIVLQMRRHPKAAVPLVLFLLVLLVSVVMHLELWQWVFDLFGIPIPGG